MGKQNKCLRDKYKSTKTIYPKIDSKSLTSEVVTEITRITEVVVEEQVVPNPTPTGTPTDLEYITINGTEYHIPGGGTQVQSNWNETDTDSPAYIQNKPTIPAAQVQANWNENDNTNPAYIQNKPTIPTAQVQSDWNESDNTSKAFIKNKPTIPANIINYRELMVSSSPVSNIDSLNVPIIQMDNTNNYLEISGYVYLTGYTAQDRRRFTIRLKITPLNETSYLERTKYYVDYNSSDICIIGVRAYCYYDTNDLKVNFSIVWEGVTTSTSHYGIVVEHIKEIINY